MKESSFQFINPFLTEFVFKVNNEYRSDESDDEDDVTLSFFSKVSKHESEQEAYVSLTVKINENESLNCPYIIIATITSRFEWSNELSDKQVSNLLVINAPSLLLSYLRPIIANITDNSPFERFNLPFCNFNDYVKNDEYSIINDTQSNVRS